ncbi:MAG: hypothetical protein U9P00_09150 [Pseudomonadota bacterium]|nr:hypothetical protein [Pseudomonadota bacterium]
MAIIPRNNLIKAHLELPDTVNETRPYLGMSQIGHDCDRYLYMYYHQMFKETISARTSRIFERGNMEEYRVIRDLTKVPGIEIYGTQTAFVDFNDQFRGHCDGFIDGVPTAEKTTHVLEIKTMADKYFKQLVKSGIEKSNKSYYIQGQMYMGYSKCDRILWMVTNKNNEDRHPERGIFNKDIFELYKNRAYTILTMGSIPDRIGSGPEYYVCRMCSARHECFNL